MKKSLLPLTALLSLLICAPLRAGWWAENDYVTGSNGFKKDSISVFTNISTRTVLAPGAAFYKDRGDYRDAVYSLRLPVMYSGDNYFLSFKPFLYPLHKNHKIIGPINSAVEAQTESSAIGAKVYVLTKLGESYDLSYLHLTVSGATAKQKTSLEDTTTKTNKTFSQNAFEVQLEKGFYNQFFLLASASGFTKPAGAKNPDLPVMDQADLAYLGTFRTITAIPEWALALQFARNMAPDFDSHLYAGFSRISFRQAEPGSSTVFGMKLRLNEGASLDLAYNFYTQKPAAGKNYYRIFVQVLF
ncbi:MAG: hypothetical protein A2021_07235 [Elusimicrobia bacterium GWF2_52_66]|nr:MAG: hypothetical protein A2X33_01440 [Elusimicrobia bacterium GWA2_51_34]OGR86389.1 MAG: hypothetical protein A2021_07235 [Elusimicrobia bacterium GWF2_52_66]HAF96191.1 hypothetical protein [Elusimicrobiota bacterium]HCE97802.1 hypothetical protein [Elusimicrobiota bacterium]